MSEKKQELHISLEAFEELLAYADTHGLNSPTKGGKAVLAIEDIASKIRKESQKQ